MILNSPTISGSLTVTGNIITSGSITISGSIASASYATNAELLDGLDSTAFATTGAYSATSASLYATSASLSATSGSLSATSGSLSATSGSLSATSGSLSTASGSFNTRVTALEVTGSALSSSLLTVSGSGYATSGSLSTASGSFDTRVATIESKYATTGSNTFTSTQVVSGSILQSGSFTTTGTIIAQTINVQTVTSSVVYSSGSNVFGNSIGNSQTFTGSVLITGSLTIAGNITSNGAAFFAGAVCVSNIISTGTSGGRYATFNAPTNGGYITFEAGGTAFGDLGSYCAQYGTGDATTLSLQSRTGYALALGTNSTEKVRIDTTGNLMVGSVSAGNAGTINVSVGCAGTTAGGLQLWATNAQTHYVQFGDGTAGAGPYAGYIGYAHSTDSLLLGAGAATRAIITSAGVACFSSTICASNAIFSTAGTPSLFNTNITSTLDFNATSRAGFTGIADNCNGVYFGMGADALGISAGIGFFRESSGWNSALAFYTNCITDGVTVPRIQEKMRITSCGNVGIGLTTPVGYASDDLVFQISNPTGGGSAMRSMMRFTNVNSGTAWGNGTFLGLDSTLDFYIGQLENAPIIFQTNSSERMRITSGGNVGIGTCSPDSLLQVQGALLGGFVNIRSFDSASMAANVGGGISFGGQYTSAGVYTDFGFIKAMKDNGTSGDYAGYINFYTRVNGGSFAERMRITSGGNVGIGTCSPSYLLTVSNTSFGGGANGLITLIGGAESSIMFMTTSYGADTNKLILDNATGAMQFRVNSAERMRITSGGQLFFTRSSGSENIIQIETYTGFTGKGVFLNMDTAEDAISIGGAGSQNAINITSSGKKVIISNLGGSGTVTVQADNSGTLVKSSDSSLKQEDKEYKIQGLAEILQLQPRAYKWLKDIEIRKEEAVTEIGFFADEVNPIIPSAAPKGFDGLYGFNDRAVTAALVKAIQELKAENDIFKTCLGIS